jgi:gluconate 2-dehydrogenase alpha chain
MTQFMRVKMEEIAKSMNPDIMQSSFKKSGAMYDVRPYQTTHNVGGNAMGADPKKSVLNRYLQAHDVHNVFVMGAGAFPQNLEYNPTGLVGGLAYWAAHALRADYLRQPRSLV